MNIRGNWAIWATPDFFSEKRRLFDVYVSSFTFGIALRRSMRRLARCQRETKSACLCLGLNPDHEISII